MLYRISYLWYTLVGSIVTISISLLVTLITSQDVKKLDPMLVSPFVRKYLTNKDVSEELHQVKVLLFLIKLLCFIFFNRVCFALRDNDV